MEKHESNPKNFLVTEKIVQSTKKNPLPDVGCIVGNFVGRNVGSLDGPSEGNILG